jgi:hypothetical protein
MAPWLQHDSYHEHIQSVYAEYKMPVANVEFMYEMGPILTYNVEVHVDSVLSLCCHALSSWQSQADDMRPAFWSILMGGGYAAWYYGPTAWDVRLMRSLTLTDAALTCSDAC